MPLDPLYILSGAGVGFIVGLTGVGGGSLMTPVLVLLFGIHPSTAVGTDLLYAAVTKSTGSLVHGYRKSVDWRTVRLLATGSVPAAVATLILLSLLGAHSTLVSRITTLVLGVALLLTALLLMFRKALERLRDAAPEPDHARQAMMTVAMGAVLGILVSISSVGAGAIGTTALILLYPKFPMVRIVGTDIAHAVPLTLVAGIGHWMIGSVNGGTLVSLLVGSIPAIVIASFLAPRVPDQKLRLLLAAVLMIVGITLVSPFR